MKMLRQGKKTVLVMLAIASLVGLIWSPMSFAQTSPRVVAWDSSPSPTISAPRVSAPAGVPSTLHAPRGKQACWDEAARYHGLDPWLLYAVAYVESRHNPSVISRPNRNGTYDIGLMQVNSIWLPALSKYGVTQTTLMDACASTYVGAWIMASNVRRYGWSWQAIAAYNVGSLNNPARVRIGKAYAGKVYKAYGKLTGTSQGIAAR